MKHLFRLIQNNRNWQKAIHLGVILAMVAAGLVTGQNVANAARAGSAVQFDGNNDYVTFDAAPELGVQNFTVETWFYQTGAGVSASTDTTNGVRLVPLVAKGAPQAEGNNRDENYVLGIRSLDNVLAGDFEIFTACSGRPAGDNTPIVGTTPILYNTWYHAAFTYDGANLRLYLNGALENTRANTCLPRYDSRQHASLGTMLTSQGARNGFFDGTLDEPRVWNRALSQAEIQANRYSELTSGSGLISRWGLNEGSGTTAGNSISGASAGTLTGGPTWVAGFPDATPPGAPTALTAVPVIGAVNLSWTAPADTDLAGYNVYRSTSPSVPLTGPLNGGTLISGTSYSNTGLTYGTRYYYVVTAVDTSGNRSAASNEVSSTSLGTALQFDGTNDYVTFGAAPGLGATNFTLEAWFNWTGGGVGTTTSGTQGLPSVIPLVSKGRGEADGSNVDMNYFLGIDTATRALAVDFEDTASGMNYPFVGTTEVTPNTWHHAAATYDSVNAVYTLYLDGAPAGTLDIGTNVLPRSDSIQHAGIATAMTSTGAAAGYFQGVIDEVRVWNIARTQAAIRSTINQELTSGTNLLARWGLNEGAGTTSASSVGTFPGTLTNGPVWMAGAPFNIVFDTLAPAAPTNLMASPRPGFILLEWTANSEPDLAGYNIYRSTSTPVVKGTPINSTLSRSPSFVDPNVIEGTRYFYAVAAADTSGNESPLSSEADAIAVTPPLAEALDLGSASAYVALGDYADTGVFTLETWLRRDGAGTAISTGTGGQTLVPLITNGTAEAETAAADINYFLGIRGSDGVLCADFEEAQTGALPGQNHPVCGVTPLQTGAWYHAAVTYDGTTWRLFVNGNQDATLAVGQPANPANTSQLAFGTSMETDGSTSGFFDGALDEVRIWNYARTQAEIALAINTRMTSPQTGLLGRWGLDEASGSITNDASGNAITGAIVGSGYSWIPGSPFNAVINLPPAAPGNPTPSDGYTEVNTAAPQLSLTVSDPEGQPLDVTFYGRPRQAAAGPDFTIAIIPDAQYYASTYPSIYTAQMNWIVSNRVTSNIVYVASLGDNVDVASNLTQWSNADAAYDILDAGGVRYGLAAGNHDGAPAGTGNFNITFPSSRYNCLPTTCGHYGSDNDNHYALFSASGVDFIIIFIEYDDGMTTTDHPVLQWANGLLQANSTRRGIVITHNLLQGGTSTAFSTQGQTIYTALRGNPNLFLMNGGHLDVASRRTDIYNGSTVYSLRSDYQSVDSQQSGYLRLMRFSPANDMIYVRTYSPTQNKDYDKSDAAQSNFSLPFGMDEVGFSTIGTVTGVASGSVASIEWPGLTDATEYEWYAVASDGTHLAASPTWSFTVNTNPTAVNLNSFRAQGDSEGVFLTWETASEVSTAGFNLYRREALGSFVQLNAKLILPQMAGQMQGSFYTYQDTDILPGRLYEYKLEVIETNMGPGDSLLLTYWPYGVFLPVLMK